MHLTKKEKKRGGKKEKKYFQTIQTMLWTRTGM